MFLHLSVILSTRGGVCLSACLDTTPWADTAPSRRLLHSCGKFIFDIDVSEKGSFLERKCVKHNQVFVLTELVVSGTQCSTRWDGSVRTAFVLGPAYNDSVTANTLVQQ